MHTPLPRCKGLTFSMIYAYIMQKRNVLKRIREGVFFFFLNNQRNAQGRPKRRGLLYAGHQIRAVDVNVMERRVENPEERRLPRGTRNRLGVYVRFRISKPRRLRGDGKIKRRNPFGSRTKRFTNHIDDNANFSMFNLGTRFIFNKNRRITQFNVNEPVLQLVCMCR